MTGELFAGFCTIYAAILGAELTFLFLISREYLNRKSNRNRLMFELLALSSSLKAMKESAQAENKIENPFELGQVTIILKRYDTRNKLPELQKLITKSIIFDVKDAKLFAEFLGMILQIKVLIENIDDYNSIQQFPDQKELLICKVDAILKKIYDINEKLLAIKVYNE
jgi:hypothetical protein